MDQALKTTIQGAYSRFLETRALKARYGQKLMIAEIARCFAALSTKTDTESDQHICLVEAGTGTGKTMAYLLATVPVALEQQKKVVVATATVALQEQLLLKDLPMLIADAGIELTYTLAKGRGRYFCISNAELLVSQQVELGQIALYEDEAARKLDQTDLERAKSLLSLFASGEWDGDRDALPETLPDGLWSSLTSDHVRCTNRRCKHFSICPFFQSRQQMDKVDLIVANHDLVLADLALGGGMILPAPEDTLYIFDEGHHLAAKARGHFSFQMSVKASRRWLSRLSRTFNKLLNESDNHALLSEKIARLTSPLSDMEQVLIELEQQLQDLLADKAAKDQKYRFAGGRIPEALQMTFEQFFVICQRALQLFEQITDLLKQAMDGEVADLSQALGEAWYPQLGAMSFRLQGLYGLANSYAKTDAGSRAPTARWLALTENSEGFDISCHSSPVSAAETLRQNLWQACHGAVVTSATLTALGTFDRIKEDLGIQASAASLQVASPFDFSNAAELHVPAMRSDPGQSDAHTQEVAEIIIRHLPEAQATLVLFSSWSQMRYVLEQIPDNMNNSVLVQGHLAKHEILRLHRERIDQGEASIIFGQASFAEGVDLPGDYLTHVIITKLPFSVPDDPVDATLTEWMASHGLNPFEHWVVPMASMRLTQATGRLLRTEHDRGRITLLDRRFVTRRYGRLLQASLPPYRLITA
ncbi:ATP-dependent DNA helicase DinG [Neptuniibacter sp. CAU 1671]|uniref:ATP-dependent DNA helicase DinG n=1 Tax=Neptuniibacter sp. CAU 1671 TaxID=3032593 RepID=UPI0031F3618C